MNTDKVLIWFIEIDENWLESINKRENNNWNYKDIKYIRESDGVRNRAVIRYDFLSINNMKKMQIGILNIATCDGCLWLKRPIGLMVNNKSH